MITYCAWCGICGAMITSPEEWENHKHEDEALMLDELEYENPHFSRYEYKVEVG